MSPSGDIDDTSIGGSGIFGVFEIQHFSVDFHFLNNDKSYKRDFFTTDTIDDGLSFHDIKSILSSDIFCLVLYTIFGQSDLVDKASWSNQRTRINRD